MQLSEAHPAKKLPKVRENNGPYGQMRDSLNLNNPRVREHADLSFKNNSKIKCCSKVDLTQGQRELVLSFK